MLGSPLWWWNFPYTVHLWRSLWLFILFSLMALSNQSEFDPIRTKSEFDLVLLMGTLPHRKSKTEIRQRNRGRRQPVSSGKWKKYNGHENKIRYDGQTVARAYRPLRVATPLKQWINPLTNLTYTYNPSTSSWLVILKKQTRIILIAFIISVNRFLRYEF